MRPTVYIPNYNGVAWIGRTLEGLREQSREVDVVVADNGSEDGSRELLRERFPEAQVLGFEENLGFGRAINRFGADSQCVKTLTEFEHNSAIGGCQQEIWGNCPRFWGPEKAWGQWSGRQSGPSGPLAKLPRH